MTMEWCEKELIGSFHYNYQRVIEIENHLLSHMKTKHVFDETAFVFG